jgi:hypothetical protein
MSKGRKASVRSRFRSFGQMYWAATIPHAMKLNATLPKKMSLGSINIS